MREILFRGKRIDNGEWVEGYYIGEQEMVEKKAHWILDKNDIFGRFHYRSIDPNTLGQYTGLTDKNGKKIFEGDIFTDGLSIWDVIYNKGSLCINFGGQYVPLTQVLRGVIDNDIIGNIHDNPELLEANNEANMD